MTESDLERALLLPVYWGRPLALSRPKVVASGLLWGCLITVSSWAFGPNWVVTFGDCTSLSGIAEA